MNQLRKTLAAICVVLVAGCTADSKPMPAVSVAPVTASLSDDVKVEALLIPYREIVVAQRPEKPASVGDCAKTLAGQLKPGDGPAAFGRLELRLRTARTVQVQVKSIKPKVVSEPAKTWAAMVSCSSSNWNERNVARPQQVGFAELVPIASANYEVPVLTPEEASKGPTELFYADTLWLSDDPATLKTSEPMILPMYLTSGSSASARYGYTFDIEVEVNGEPKTATITDHDGKPFWINPLAESAARLEWLQDTQQWTWDRAYDPAKAEPFPLPGARACGAVTVAEMTPIVGAPVWVHGANYETSTYCNWSNANTGMGFRVNIQTHPTESNAIENYTNRFNALSRTTYKNYAPLSLPQFGPRATIVGPFALIQHGRDYIEFSTQEKNAANNAQIRQLILAAGSRLGLDK